MCVFRIEFLCTQTGYGLEIAFSGLIETAPLSRASETLVTNCDGEM